MARRATAKQKKAQARFRAAAKACKVEFKKGGSGKARRRAFNNCIKRKLK